MYLKREKKKASNLRRKRMFFSHWQRPTRNPMRDRMYEFSRFPLYTVDRYYVSAGSRYSCTTLFYPQCRQPPLILLRLSFYSPFNCEMRNLSRWLPTCVQAIYTRFSYDIDTIHMYVCVHGTFMKWQKVKYFSLFICYSDDIEYFFR